MIVIEKLEIVFKVETYAASPHQRDAGLTILLMSILDKSYVVKRPTLKSFP